MSLIKITAYKCRFCGQIFEHDKGGYHEIVCRYEPRSRTCTTCGFSGELRSSDATGNVRYCPRADKMFDYPCEKYCSEYKIDPYFKELIE